MVQMDSDLSINEVIERCRHYWWLAVVLAISGLLAGFLVARMPRYQSVITVWSIPLVVRDQPVSRVDAGYSEALYASILVWLQEEWRSNMEDAGTDVTVRLNRQTYQLMAEGSASGFDEQAAQTFENLSAWIAGKPVVTASGEVVTDNCLADINNDAIGLCPTGGHAESQEEGQTTVLTDTLSELVWVGEKSGPVANQKYPPMKVIAPLVSLVIGLLTFFTFILVDVSGKKPVKSS